VRAALLLALLLAPLSCAHGRQGAWRCSRDGLRAGRELCGAGMAVAAGGPSLRCSAAATGARVVIADGLFALLDEAVGRAGPVLGADAASIRGRLADARRRGVEIEGSFVAVQRDAPGRTTCRVTVVLPADGLRASARGVLAGAGIGSSQTEAILAKLR